MKRNGLFLAFMLGASIATAVAVQAQPASQVKPAAGGGLSEASFRPVSNDDLSKWTNFTGCSFSLSRGKDMLVLFDTQDAKKTALFKIDGKLTYVVATPGKPAGAYWSGKMADTEFRLIKGKPDPKFRSDGGGKAGAGRLEWNGPTARGTLALRWEEGC